MKNLHSEPEPVHLPLSLSSSSPSPPLPPSLLPLFILPPLLPPSPPPSSLPPPPLPPTPAIHRLDRLTSGLLLFAKSLSTAQKLEQQIRERKVAKEYICMVYGEFPRSVSRVSLFGGGGGGGGGGHLPPLVKYLPTLATLFGWLHTHPLLYHPLILSVQLIVPPPPPPRRYS